MSAPYLQITLLNFSVFRKALWFCGLPTWDVSRATPRVTLLPLLQMTQFWLCVTGQHHQAIARIKICNLYTETAANWTAMSLSLSYLPLCLGMAGGKQWQVSVASPAVCIKNNHCFSFANWERDFDKASFERSNLLCADSSLKRFAVSLCEICGWSRLIFTGFLPGLRLCHANLPSFINLDFSVEVYQQPFKNYLKDCFS